ncbi:MAG: CooT family nickel-binding protein [Candidatus Methanoperedens sp.]|jgi:predicted RNA-binding protein|nr:CooT family nickel-binding protein [Candidatus Methanoperedens sp.]PKL54507.1 MAG: RNA-binding protein [Candidatus Methanoperedenaceae archaeon HGW-Methanoperedenaceae-1]
MCELKVIFNGDIIMEDVVRITDEDGSITLHGMLGDVKTVSGKIVDVNLTKQEAIIDS